MFIPVCRSTIRLMLMLMTASASAQSPSANFNDHQNMMDQLGIKKLRPGPNPNDQSTFDEATANPYTNSMPDVLTMRDGTKVTRPEQWPARRAEIQEDFAREIYGRIPAAVPPVTWEVTATTNGITGGIPTITKTLVGHVDNSGYTNITVNIQASFTVPANVTIPVPMMIEFGFGGLRTNAMSAQNRSTTNTPATNNLARRRGGEPAWHTLAISNGWGYATIVPTSFQPDNNHLTSGIIGLVNKGQPRKPDDWGALRAWQWGVSQMINYFETNSGSMVDAKKIGIEGLSRYGKAALVTEAFEPRIAVGLIGSSGEGGAKLHRHIFGEAVENLAGGEYYWMAGNLIKYGASDPLKTAADLPVDSHELIAMCAPRPCIISYGIVERGDAKWVDAHGSFMAGVLAGPVYRLLGKKDFGTPGDYLTDPMPPVNQLIGGELAWRQHDGGHDVTPNWPAFFDWVGDYVKALPVSVPGNTLRVILIGGQSNADGRALGGGLPLSPINLQAPQTNVPFYYYTYGSARNPDGSYGKMTTIRPGCTQMPVGGFGPEVTLGHCLSRNIERHFDAQVAIIKYAKGGSSLAFDWKAGGDTTTNDDGLHYQIFQRVVQDGMAKLRSTFPTSTIQIVGMVWVQGETDIDKGNAAASAYSKNLTQFISDVRQTFGTSLPFVFSRISAQQKVYSSETSKSYSSYLVIRSGQEQVANTMTNVYMIDTDSPDFTMNPDFLHFDAGGQMALGAAFAARLTSILDPGP